MPAVGREFITAEPTGARTVSLPALYQSHRSCRFQIGELGEVAGIYRPGEHKLE